MEHYGEVDKMISGFGAAVLMLFGVWLTALGIASLIDWRRSKKKGKGRKWK